MIGYNLTGDYERGITSTRWATTPAMDCSNYANVRLRFQRWLGVYYGSTTYGGSTGDNAYIEVSNNGTTWTPVWHNTNSRLTTAAWAEVEYDISAVADGQSTVYVRWGMGTTNSSLNDDSCGWNIDEVIVHGDYTAPANMFSNWIAGKTGVDGQTGVGDDPDGDGNDNGVENFFGTEPGMFSRGLVAVAASGNTFTFTHPQGTLADDLVASYRWSADLASFHGHGEADSETTVSFSTAADTPETSMTTVTATVTGTPMERLFVIVEVEME